MKLPNSSRFRELWSRLQNLWQHAEVLLHEHGLDHIDETVQTRTHKFAHFCSLVGVSFMRNRCPIRAAALAYTTILALVPLLAVALSVTTSVLKQQGETAIYDLLETVVENAAPSLSLEPTGDEETMAISRLELVDQIKTYIDNFKTGAITTTAIVALLFLAISLFSTIESTFNDMWGVSQNRGWVTRIIQYWAALTLGPIFLASAISLTSAPHLQATKEWVADLGAFGGFLILFFSYYVLPFAILSAFCALLYLLMPNTRVHWKAATVGGLVAGALLQINSKLGVLYASRVVAYSTIYGSLGVLPIFLVGLYISWCIVLLGAQVAYAVQNRKAYLQEKKAERINQRCREFVALRLMVAIADRFITGQAAPSPSELATSLGIPLKLVSQIARILLQSKLIVEVFGPDLGYFPAKPVERITAQEILRAMRSGYGNELETTGDHTRNLLREHYHAIEMAQQSVAAKLSLSALVQSARDLNERSGDSPATSN